MIKRLFSEEVAGFPNVPSLPLCPFDLRWEMLLSEDLGDVKHMIKWK